MRDHEIYLLHDITYRDFAQEHQLIAELCPEYTVTVYSFSKIYGLAGMRIGAVVGVPEIINSIRSIVINDLGTNLVAQNGAMTAIESNQNGWKESKHHPPEPGHHQTSSGSS